MESPRTRSSEVSFSWGLSGLQSVTFDRLLTCLSLGHGRWMATTAETDFCHIVLRHILMSDHYTRLYPQDLHCHDVLKNLFLNTIKYKYVRVHILIRNNYCNFFHNCSLVPLVTFQLYICIMPGLHMKLLSHYSCALFIRLMISPQIPM